MCGITCISTLKIFNWLINTTICKQSFKKFTETLPSIIILSVILATQICYFQPPPPPPHGHFPPDISPRTFPPGHFPPDISPGHFPLDISPRKFPPGHFLLVISPGHLYRAFLDFFIWYEHIFPLPSPGVFLLGHLPLDIPP